ncbi:glucose uptake protein GlcU [Tenacibaculum adriaticum]|uniref:Glucose uptake protein GlcU n=1 Tax=Tenacibaculum adriaticum TaxID=413713 RepID=A0A5S5DUU0_9FLAO|nr:EamA family transporter [Tenacibaculum adriaticum]TYP99058.1 glucose uptake protein GlcU [Tenacibaculum adriaticum]
MIYLALSILISSSLFAIFKLFEVYKINTLQAIVVNYFVAFTIGYSLSNVKIGLTDIPQQPWFLGAIFLGFLFISIFNVMALTSQINGLSVASVSGKMSVVIPVIFGVFVYNESLGFIKVIGILLALIAVYLTSMKSDSFVKEKHLLIYPILLFLGSGVIDTSIKYIETTYVQDGGVPIFSASIFGIAFVIGLFFVTYRSFKTKFVFEWKNILGGIALGIPNYFSIVFLLKALKTDGLESSTLFTINNVSIVLLTTVFGLILFKEKLQVKNWIGIVIAITSIIIVAIA